MNVGFTFEAAATLLQSANETLVQRVHIDIGCAGLEQAGLGEFRQQHGHQRLDLPRVEQLQQRRVRAHGLPVTLDLARLLARADHQRAARCKQVAVDEAARRPLEEPAARARECAHLGVAIRLAEERRRSSRRMHAGLGFPLEHEDLRLVREEISNGGTGDSGADDDGVDRLRVTHAGVSAGDSVCRATTVVAAISPVTLPSVANASGIVSTANKRPSGATGNPIDCTTGMFIAIRLTWPGNPTEPRLITTASAAPTASWLADRSTP